MEGVAPNRKHDWTDELRATAEALAGWRREHPGAGLDAIEDAVDEELEGFRARLVAELAMDSGQAEFAGKGTAERPTCRLCGAAVISRGQMGATAGDTAGEGGSTETELRLVWAVRGGLFPPSMRSWG